jgi:Spy/CpxP family protein refolding chaperone
MEQLDKNIQSLDEKVNALKDENRKKQTTTQKLKSQLSTPEAREKMDQLCQEVVKDNKMYIRTHHSIIE